MKKIIRKSVFETNSSSSHSLSFDEEDRLNIIDKKDLPNTIVLEGGDYGWENDRLNAWYEKANYLYQGFIDHDEYKELLIKALEELGIKVEEAVNNYGYIDHQSENASYCVFDDLLNDDDEKKKKCLQDFIFSTTSYIETGNDNDW